MNPKSNINIFESILKQKDNLIEDLQKQLLETNSCDSNKKDTKYLKI